MNKLWHEMGMILRKAQTIAIAGHVNPDGDCIGAINGLGLSLESMGKEVDRLCEEKPRHLSYIPGASTMVEVDPQKKYDVFVLLDLGDRPRMGKASRAMDRADFSLNFDHHQTNERICQLNSVIKDASSTCEILASFLQEEDFPIPKEAATALFAGLITDSNRFLYDTARSRAMRIGADLIDLGADADLVYLKEYQAIEPGLFAFQGKVVSEAEFLQGGRVALANVTQAMLKEYKISMSEAESAVDVLRNLSQVEVAVLVKNMTDDLQKISFRSKEFFNVSAVAEKFGGGGHIKAAGASIQGKNEDVYKQMKAFFEDLPADAFYPEKLNIKGTC